MKKIAILILSILIAGLFVACNQDITVDAQTYANMEVGTFVLNGQNYATLQEAVNAKLGKSAKALGDNDGVIYLTRNASGPGAVINSAVTGGVTIDFAGYTYSFTNVTGLQGGEAPKPESFGLAVTNGAQVTLKGMEKIDLNDKSTSALTMVYIEGAETKLSIESAPKMVVEPEQYVFWAANGATLTIGGETQVGGGVAATAESSVKTTETAKLEKTTLKAEKSTIIFNSTVTPTIQTLQVSDAANLVVAGAAPEVTKNDSDANASYTIINTTDATVTIPGTTGAADISVPQNSEVAVEDGTEKTQDIDGVAAIEYVIYGTLKAAVDAAKDGDTIILLKDYSCDTGKDKRVEFDYDKSIAIDLNSKTLTACFLVRNGAISVDNGTIEGADGNNTVFRIIGSGDTQKAKDSIVVTIGKDAVLTGNYTVMIRENDTEATKNAYGVTLNINGRVSGNNPLWAMGNIEKGNSVININSSAVLTVTDVTENDKDDRGTCIANQGYVSTTIYDGATLKGYESAIEVRAGEVNILGGTFTGTATPPNVTGNGSGTTTVGAAVAVAQHTTKLNTIVNISGGSFEGYNALCISNPQNNETENVKVSVSGGTFSGVDFSDTKKKADPTAVVCTDERVEKFITGGTFNTDPSEYVAEGYEAVAQGSTWKVSARVPVATIGDTIYYSLKEAVDAAESGDTVTLLRNYSGAGIFVGEKDAKNITVDLGGNTYTCTGPAVGSSGTETQAWHLEKGNKITIKRGKLTSVKDSGVKMLVQNYCNLTLTNVELDGTNLGSGSYTMSNNYGVIVIDGATSITAAEGGVAFDVCTGWGGYDSVSVTVDTTGTITGIVEIADYDSTCNDTPVVFNVKNGVFYSSFRVPAIEYGTSDISVSITGGKFAAEFVDEESLSYLNEFVAEGYKVVLDDDDFYVVVELELVEAKDSTCTDKGNHTYWKVSDNDQQKYIYDEINGILKVAVESDIVIPARHRYVLTGISNVDTDKGTCTASFECINCTEGDGHTKQEEWHYLDKKAESFELYATVTNDPSFEDKTIIEVDNKSEITYKTSPSNGLPKSFGIICQVNDKPVIHNENTERGLKLYNRFKELEEKYWYFTNVDFGTKGRNKAWGHMLLLTGQIAEIGLNNVEFKNDSTSGNEDEYSKMTSWIGLWENQELAEQYTYDTETGAKSWYPLKDKNASTYVNLKGVTYPTGEDAKPLFQIQGYELSVMKGGNAPSSGVVGHKDCYEAVHISFSAAGDDFISKQINIQSDQRYHDGVHNEWFLNGIIMKGIPDTEGIYGDPNYGKK